MNPSVIEVVAYVTGLEAERITVISPFPLIGSEALALLKDQRVRILATAPLPGGIGFENENRLIETPADHFPVPLAEKQGVAVFLGGPAMFSGVDLLLSLLSGRWSFVCRIRGSFSHCKVYRLLFNHWKSEITWHLRRMPESHPVIRLVSRLREIELLQRLWRGRQVTHSDGILPSESDGKDDEAIYQEIITALENGTSGGLDVVPGRILHVNAGLAAGGAERQICLTLTGLKRHGHSDVALLGEYKGAMDDFPPFVQTLDAAKIPYESVTKVSVPGVLRRLPKRVATALSQLPLNLLSDILALVEEFNRRRPQIVQAWQDSTSISAGIAAAIAGVPGIMLCGRNVSPVCLPTYQPHFRAAYRAILQMPGVVLTNNSRAGATSYARWLDIDADSIPVVYNAVDSVEPRPMLPADWRRSLSIPAAAPVIGGIFRLTPQKRPILWLQAVAVLGESFPDAHFVIAGEGGMRDEILHHAATLGLDGRFHLLGNESDVSALYAIFDVFFIVSREEGLANVLLEAQKAGVPVVCTDVGGNKEAVQPDRTAVIVEMPDPDALAFALTRVLNDKHWRASAKIAGPQHIEANFSTDAMIEKTIMLYKVARLTGRTIC